jgi:hypothetical protein
MLTFSQYLKSYVSLWGALAAAMGISGPFLKSFNVLAPPIEYAGGATIFIFLAMILIPYLTHQAFGLGQKAAHQVSLVFACAAIVVVFGYCFWICPAYIYVSKPSTGQERREIIAKESDYTDRVKAFVQTNESNLFTRKQIIENVQLPSLTMIFTESGLLHAEALVATGYVGCILCIEGAFCFLILGESIHRRAVP